MIGVYGFQIAIGSDPALAGELRVTGNTFRRFAAGSAADGYTESCDLLHPHLLIFTSIHAISSQVQ